MTSSASFRLLLTPPASGAWNMAVDQAILAAVSRGEAPPTLRLYAWSPPCLSLGRHQPAEDADTARLAARGWEIVRRPTGGRAILHTDELTYAFIAPAGHPLMRGGVLPGYRSIAVGLLEALRLLGIAARMEDERPPEKHPAAVCFEVPSSYEITVRGRKLIGSAQVRREGAVLQHGSLPLWGDLGRIADALRFPNEAAREAARAAVRQRAVTASEAAGRTITWWEAANAFYRGFAAAWKANFAFGVLNEGEWASVRREI
jgi:lipoate-protein ligase A